jgi:hypothetical protein
MLERERFFPGPSCSVAKRRNRFVEHFLVSLNHDYAAGYRNGLGVGRTPRHAALHLTPRAHDNIRRFPGALAVHHCDVIVHTNHSELVSYSAGMENGRV